VVNLGAGVALDDLLHHDERATEPTLAYLLARMVHDDKAEQSFPEPMGVLRAVQKPVFGELVQRQIDDVTRTKGKGDLQALLTGDETWTVE
jgi:2-oxoglutarate ferredoxin oxidoreductase subunit beta